LYQIAEERDGGICNGLKNRHSCKVIQLRMYFVP
jgi:hypothetical protein